jgi:3-methylfumaryl-CoA hydratase
VSTPTASKPQDYTAWVGRSETSNDVASHSAKRALAALLDTPESGVGGEKLVPLGHWLQFTPTAATRELGPDGHPKLGGFMPPLDLPRRMWAGSTVEFHSPISVGQQLSRTTTIESITPKNGSSGRLCFVVLRHDVNADDQTALIERQTIVYREALESDPAAPVASRGPRAATETPDGWDWTRALTPNEITLFRYSALTFNSHRIHYDLPYATGVEGYPGLVVHGPLMATLVVDSFLQNHPSAELTAFEFAARSPVFVGEQIHICGRATNEQSVELAVIAPGGKTAITARIEYG